MTASLVLDATILWVVTLVIAILASIIDFDSAIVNFIFILISTLAWLAITLHAGPYWLQYVAFGILVVVFIFQLLVFIYILA